MRVRTADGEVWWVGRRWLPWQPRRKQRLETDLHDGITVADVGDDFESLGCSFIFIIGAILVAFPLLLVGIIFIAEWLVVLLILPILTLLRVAWGMPWIVVARKWDGKRLRTRYTGQVSGWQASRQLIATAGAEIREHAAPVSLAPQQRDR